MTHERPDTGDPAQGRINALERGRDGHRTVGECSEGVVEPTEEPLPRRDRPLRRAAQEGNDPAHDRKVTDPGQVGAQQRRGDDLRQARRAAMTAARRSAS